MKPQIIPGPPPAPIGTEPAPEILPEVGDCHLYDWYHSHDHDHEHEHHGLSMEQDLFYHYDTDKDCQISKVEFYSSGGRFFDDFDSNGDAVLNYAEFFAYTESEWYVPESFENDYDLGTALSPFHLADTDKDGFVSVSEAWLSFGTADINADEYFTAFELEMEGCDANDDNVLDEDEFEHFWTMDPICDMTPLYSYIFDLVDTDDNKSISKAELNSALLAYGEGLSEVELQEKIEKFDKDGEGSWTYGEFVGWANASRYGQEAVNVDYENEDDHDNEHVYDYDYINEEFQEIDSDGDGLVSASEFWEVYGYGDLETGINLIKSDWAGCDTNGDEVLNAKEFEKYWNSECPYEYEDFESNNEAEENEEYEEYDYDDILSGMFKETDSNEDGFVSASEVWEMFQLSFGYEDLDDEEQINLIQSGWEDAGCDTNDDELLNEDEFIKWGNNECSSNNKFEDGGEFDEQYDSDENDNEVDGEGDYDYINEEFKEIDSNGDGLVSASEFWEVYGYGDLETGINLIKSDWAGCDTNGDEVLDAKEFENYWNSECPYEYENGENEEDDGGDDESEYDNDESGNEGNGEDNNDLALKTFRKLDSNEDGFVSASEIFEDMGFNDLDSEEQINLIKLEWKREGCDENDDDLLNEEEFVNYWNYECPSSDMYGSMSPFELADSDEDGFVSVSEAWLKFGSASNNTEAHYASFKLELEGCDLNNDEVLDKDEFEYLWNGDPICDQDPLHRYLFGLMDADHDKNVTTTELNSALSAYGGEAMSDAELLKEIGEFDLDGEGTWNYEEFVGWLNARRYEGVNGTVDNVSGANDEFDDDADDEEDHVPEGFKDVDSDGDGFVSPHEFFVYKGFGNWEDEEEIEVEINKIKLEWKEEGCDENGDELLNLQEMINFWNFKCPSSSGYDYGFKRADSDGDGFVSPHEFFEDMGYGDWDEEELQIQINTIKSEWKEEGCDENSDELLNEEEFNNYWSADCSSSSTKYGDDDDTEYTEEHEGDDDYDSDYDSEIFKEVDSNGDGFVSAREIFVDMGFGLWEVGDEEEIQIEINKIKLEWKEDGCDENGDELLNEEEFGNYWNFECPLNKYGDEEFDNETVDDGEEEIVFQK